ncbi:MAG: RNA-binding S4 domain-containing protein [Oscillospiraceae bacterium]|jgi:ribosome-associated protein|nr:RNA-binding S4 domain-containing protein [Oscillospiraceae bacterium]
MDKIYITPPFIKLEQFLKFSSLVSTGGEAKLLIQSGKVAVNGEICTVRGKKLFGGEKVTLETEGFEVALK